MGLLRKFLEEVERDLPPNPYRERITAFFQYNLRVCEEAKTPEEIESKIGLGQIEELITMVTHVVVVYYYLFDNVVGRNITCAG